MILKVHTIWIIVTKQSWGYEVQIRNIVNKIVIIRYGVRYWGYYFIRYLNV